jgi:hypothetical protein
LRIGAASGGTKKTEANQILPNDKKNMKHNAIIT